MTIVIRRKTIRRVLWWVQGGLFACSVFLLCYCGFAVTDAWMFQRRESNALDRLLQVQSAASESNALDRLPRAQSAASGSTPQSESPTHTNRAAAAAADGLIGRIEIPRLLLSAVVCEGVEETTLQRAVGHVPGTALPGQPGNVGLAGHRDTFFRSLKDLRVKDEVQFSTLKGSFKYKIESLTVVEPDYVAALAPSSENVLTLVTCYPFSYVGSAPKRFVARAIQVSPLTASSSTVE